MFIQSEYNMLSLVKGVYKQVEDVLHDDAYSLSLPSLAVIYNRLCIVEGTYSDEEKLLPKTQGLYLALRTTRDFIHFLRTCPLLTEWERSMIRVCTVKDRSAKLSIKGMQKMTINTSVTFGAAVEFLGIHHTYDHVMILNCGSGTIKFQLYGREQGAVRPLYEYKPDDPDGHAKTSLSSIQIGEFQPRETMMASEFIVRVKKWLAVFVAFLANNDIQNVPIAALVTGSIRAFWQKHDASNGLEEGVSAMLYAVCPTIVAASGISFFIEQKTEGLLEYSALATVVETESCPRAAKLLLGVCIGRGSTQIPFVTKESTVCVASVSRGMQNQDMAIDMVRTCATDAMNDFACNVRLALDNGQIPVVALKSGALLAYTDAGRIDMVLGEIVDGILRDITTKNPWADRSVASTNRHVTMWTVSLKDGTVSDASRKQMQTAVWTYAPDHIKLK
jgi:hypothetical protein